ncbi:hypothetical protein CEXT_560031 [Caerostris extrusa]|uniref:Uncharacterized protein n=1 Tax=Caerostris extrusa TaxID=172846 RepID=A0AAV4RZ91_CAEEX|nr:hypothetical protein CEXT_560031 [Caerostris extrusa]
MFPVCQATKGCEWLETRPQLKKPDRSIYSQPRTPPYPVSPRSCKMGNAYKRSLDSRRTPVFQAASGCYGTGTGKASFSGKNLVFGAGVVVCRDD